MTGSMIGAVFNNRYQITERIGIGGMAEVYRAQDAVLGRTVAIKVMLPQYAADPTFTKRFKQEAASAANLQSPYIVNIYDWGQDDGTYYIVMEYVRGSDLKTGILERGAINQRKVAEIGSQVCRALSVAHQQDIIHRDIKPQNIMVQPDGNVKVMDFGIARAKNSVTTQTSSVLGTAHYISPEQAQGKELTAASDIYSLGVVLYEAATGQLPFDGPDAVSVALKQVNDFPVPPRQINPAIDPALEAIIMKAMEKDPRNRFATANEMRIELNNFLAGRPVNVAGMGAAIGGFGAAETAVMNGGYVARSGRQAPIDGTAVMPASNMPGRSAVKPVSTNSNYRQSSASDDRGGRGGGSKKGIVIAIVAVIAVIAIAFGAFALLGGGGSGEPVPNVVGQQEEVARQTLEDAGFVVSVQNESSDDAEKGEVIRQDPRAGTRHEEGTTVTITVSLGAEETSVPDLYNKSIDEAKALCEKAGLVLESGGVDNSSEVDKNKIMDQSPAAGEVVEKGSTVTYVLSMGAATHDVTDVTGWHENEATQELRSLGFEVSVQYESSDEWEAGLVIRYNPTGKADEGDTITIYVSTGPEGPEMIYVESVVGWTYGEANAYLTGLGLGVVIDAGPADASARVTGQNYSNMEVEEGSTIHLTTEASGGTGGGEGEENVTPEEA